MLCKAISLWRFYLVQIPKAGAAEPREEPGDISGFVLFCFFTAWHLWLRLLNLAGRSQIRHIEIR